MSKNIGIVPNFFSLMNWWIRDKAAEVFVPHALTPLT